MQVKDIQYIGPLITYFKSNYLKEPLIHYYYSTYSKIIKTPQEFPGTNINEKFRNLFELIQSEKRNLISLEK